jgi:DNA repair exonuclease SbcCD ATPase subunit
MAAAQRLAEQLAAHSLCVQDLESSAQQVTTGMESIRTELADLAEKTAALGEKVHAALEQPHASLDQVQAQAQQLERVCGAVRKVFAALSQATLVARRQAEELRVTGDGAEERCTRLTDETTKAATVLREWVEETVRVQARLERTLSQCPSVQATHPLETVHGINRLFHGFPGSDRSHEADIDAHADQADEAKAGALTRPSARADEIARLIAEASTHEAADVAG